MGIPRYAIPAVAASLLLAAACGQPEGDRPREDAPATEQIPAGGTEEAAAYQASIEAWHAARIERLRAEDGWLTLVGLHELRPGENEVGSAYGKPVRLPEGAPDHLGAILLAEDGGLAFHPARPVVVAGESREESFPLRSDAEGEPTVIEHGSLHFYVIRRGPSLYVRVKDRESEVRRSFTGIERFEVDPAWRILARWEPYDPPRTLEIPNVLGRVEKEPLPGAVVFPWDGEEVRLHPTGDPDQSLFLVFGDATNGESTYGGGRFLSLEPPGGDGAIVVDFNRAYNPPCVFTPYATCPLPPEGNVLDFVVPAGEKVWGHGH